MYQLLIIILINDVERLFGAQRATQPQREHQRKVSSAHISGADRRRGKFVIDFPLTNYKFSRNEEIFIRGQCE